MLHPASAHESVIRAESVARRLIHPDFWLGAPLKIVLILVVAGVLNVASRILIRKITNGVARGTRARIVAKRTARGADWVQDNALASERQVQRARTIGSVLRSVTSIVIWAVALLTIVPELGINIAPILASAGIAGVALSFGAQSLVKDYLSGIFIVAEDQLGIGDVVDLGEANGTVEFVGLRVTQVRDVHGTLWHVRNGEILRVGNSSQGWARTVLDVQVPYDSNIDAVSALLLGAALEVKRTTEIGRSVIGVPEVWGVEELTGEAITVRMAVKTAPLQQWAVARELRKRLKTTLDEHGYRIPLVQQCVVHEAHDARQGRDEGHGAATASLSQASPEDGAGAPNQPVPASPEGAPGSSPGSAASAGKTPDSGPGRRGWFSFRGADRRNR